MLLFLIRFPFFSVSASCPDSVPSSTETGGTNYLAPEGLSGKEKGFVCTCIIVRLKAV